SWRVLLYHEGEMHRTNRGVILLSFSPPKPQRCVEMAVDRDPRNSNESVRSPQKQGNAQKIGLLALLAVVAVGGFWLLGDRLSLEYLATQEAALREYRAQYPFWAAVIAIALYIAVAGFSLP